MNRLERKSLRTRRGTSVKKMWNYCRFVYDSRTTIILEFYAGLSVRPWGNEAYIREVIHFSFLSYERRMTFFACRMWKIPTIPEE